jgi:hypothetical protein
VRTIGISGESSIDRRIRRFPAGRAELRFGAISPGGCLALLLIAAALATAWLSSGVGTFEALRFVVFEVLYVLLPGCLLYLVLSPKPGGWLRVLAIGWPCGYALEIGGFALTAALHSRATFALLPLVALVVLGLPYLARVRRARRVETNGSRTAAPRRSHTARGTGLPRPPKELQLACGEAYDGARGRHWICDARNIDALVVALAVCAALALLAFTFFAPYPLPAHAHSVSYSEDNVFDISLAADALHHWPITEPWVAGQPLHYYTGVFIHAAAIDQVTGVALSTTFLRLLPSAILLLVALQTWSLGRSIGDSRWVGPLAVVLLLVLEDLNLDPTRIEIFHINPFNQFSLSPSFAFGVPFFLGALELLQSRLLPGARHASAATKRALVLLLILVLGAGAAKTFAAADLIGGLGLLWLWYVLTGRSIRVLSASLALSLAAIGVVYVVMLSGGVSGTLGVHPFDFITSGATLVKVKSALRSVIGGSDLWILPLLAGVPVIAACLFAPLLGALWMLRRHRPTPSTVALPCMLFTAGVLAYVTLGAPGGVEGVFLVYGYVALAPVAAMGLIRLWEDAPGDARLKLGWACVAVLSLALALAASLQALSLTGRARDAAYAIAYGLVIGGIIFAADSCARLFAPTVRAYSTRVLACCIPLLGVLGLVKPITLAGVGAWKTLRHQQIATRDSASSYGMTAALYRGLLWVRGHTTSCDVLAVNNHRESAHTKTSLYFYYSAFTERRVYLESWYYTPNGTRLADPFPQRLRLNTEAVSDGSAGALRRLARAGVSYVLIDKTHGGGAVAARSVGRLVFANSALDVYRLYTPKGPRSAGSNGTEAPNHACGTVD